LEDIGFAAFVTADVTVHTLGNIYADVLPTLVTIEGLEVFDLDSRELHAGTPRLAEFLVHLDVRPLQKSSDIGAASNAVTFLLGLGIKGSSPSCS
jgi:hypothetical protein